MSKDPYLERALLDVVLGAVVYPAPTLVYVALFSTVPSELVLGTEVSYPNYGRLEVPNNGTYWSAAQTTAGVSSKWNLLPLRWPAAVVTGSVSLVGWAIYDAATVGNRLYFGSLVASRTLTSGKKPVFGAGALILFEE